MNPTSTDEARVFGRVPAGPYILSYGDGGGTRLELAGGVEESTAEHIRDALAIPTDALTSTVDVADATTNRVDQAIALLKAAADGGLADQSVINTEIDVVVAGLSKLDKEHRFDEELKLARTLANLLALIEHWLQLIRMLRGYLDSTSRHLEAWARQELGTLSACVRRSDDARRYLSSARRTRRDLGDNPGLAATNQNLALTEPGLPWVSGRHRRWAVRRGCAVGAAAAALIGGSVGLAYGHFRDQSPPTAAPAPPSLTLLGRSPQGDRLTFHGVAATAGGYRRIVDLRIYSAAAPTTALLTRLVPLRADGAYAVNFADPLGNGRYVARLSQGWQHGLAHIQSRPFPFTVALPIVGVGTPSPKAGTITLSEPSGSPDLASPLIVSGTNAINGNIDTPDVAVDVYAGDSTAGTLVEHGDPTPATNGAWRFSFSTDGLTAGDDYTVIAYQISADGSTTGSTTEPLTFEWGVGDPDSGSTSTPTSSPVSIS